MNNIFKNHPMLPRYILSSLIGNILFYLYLEWGNIRFEMFLIVGLMTVIGFFVGYGILIFLKKWNEIEKASYEYRKKHPTKDEPW